MKKKTDISQIRFRYKKGALDIKNTSINPFLQFNKWLMEAIKNKVFGYYFKKSSLRKNIYFLKNDFDILSIQRNLKIIGIFYRLYKRDKKPQYLKYLPYTWKLIELRMKSKIFKNLERILLSAVNKKLRKKQNF